MKKTIEEIGEKKDDPYGMRHELPSMDQWILDYRKIKLVGSHPSLNTPVNRTHWTESEWISFKNAHRSKEQQRKWNGNWHKA